MDTNMEWIVTQIILISLLVCCGFWLFYNALNRNSSKMPMKILGRWLSDQNQLKKFKAIAFSFGCICVVLALYFSISSIDKYNQITTPVIGVGISIHSHPNLPIESENIEIMIDGEHQQGLLVTFGYNYNHTTTIEAYYTENNTTFPYNFIGDSNVTEIKITRDGMNIEIEILEPPSYAYNNTITLSEYVEQDTIVCSGINGEISLESTYYFS